MTNLIDFENNHVDEFIVNQYKNPPFNAVLGGGSVEIGPSKAHSPTKYLTVFKAEFIPLPTFLLSFTPGHGQKRVSLFAGAEPEGSIQIAPTITFSGTLLAFDKNGAPVGADGPKRLDLKSCSTVFQVTAAPNVIASAMLTTTSEDSLGNVFPFNLIVDDIEFEADPSPPANPITTITIERVLPDRIIYGITLDSGGGKFTPTGRVVPEPPINPFIKASEEVRDVFVNLLAYEVAGLVQTSANEEVRQAALRAASVRLSRLAKEFSQISQKQTPQLSSGTENSKRGKAPRR